MKILIVDDNARKYARFVEVATASGVDREDIEFAASANDARDRLEANRYELLVLDIVLPLRPEEAPDDKHSIDLLVEILESDDLNKPNQIVGITAHDLIAKKVAPIFEERLWTIIPYSESNDEWISRLINCVKYLQGNSARAVSLTSQVDVAIICALRDPELTAVLQLPWGFGPARPISDLTFVHDGEFICKGNSYSVAAVAAPRMGMIATALLAAEIVEAMRPRYLVMTGVCAGVKGRANIGDVLLADPSWDWQSGKRVRDKDNNAQFAVSPHQLGVASRVRAHVEQLRADQAALRVISREWTGARPGEPRIIIGPVASGSAVLSDREVVSQIRQQHRELCGIEMEIYGLYAAAENSRAPRPTAFALKGVCDFADPDKADDYQQYAAYMSAQVMRLMFERFGHRLFEVEKPR